jgi:hypothetical protein
MHVLAYPSVMAVISELSVCYHNSFFEKFKALRWSFETVFHTNDIRVTFASELLAIFRLLFALQTSERFVWFEVLTAVVINVAIFCDIAPCSPYENRRFGEMYHLQLRCRKLAQKPASSRWLLLFARFFTLKMEAVCSCETSVHTRTTPRYTPLHLLKRHINYPLCCPATLFGSVVRLVSYPVIHSTKYNGRSINKMLSDRISSSVVQCYYSTF